MKRVLFGALFSLVIFSSAEATRPERFHSYLAAGLLYSFPASVRAGYGDWEAGSYSSMLGVSKIFHWSKHYYASLGVGAVLINGATPSFYASMGADYGLFWRIGLRGEFYAIQALNGFAEGGLLLGVSLRF